MQSVLVQPEFIEGDHERDLEGQAGRALNARLRALNLNLSVTRCHAGTCLLGCLPVSSTDKVLRMKESYPKSSLFIPIKRVLFHLLKLKLEESSCSGFYEADSNDEKNPMKLNSEITV